MNAALLKRWLREGQWLLLACAVALFGFCWLRVWVITQLEMGSFERILEQVWDKYEKYSPVPLSHLLTYHGRVAMAYSEPMVVLCISAWAIARGSDSVAGHLGRGTMEMLLAQPLRRWEIVASQSLVNLLGLVVLVVAAWCGIGAGIQASQVKESRPQNVTIPGLPIRIPLPFAPEEEVRVPLSEKTKASYFVAPTLNLLALGVLIGGLTTMLSAGDQMRWRSIGVVVGFLVVQLTMRVLALATPQLGWMAYLTVFSAYAPEAMVRIAVERPDQLWSLLEWGPQGGIQRPGPLGYDLILLLPGLAFYMIGTWIFTRRDLPAPL